MSSPAPEFSRPLRLDQIGIDAKPQRITANEAERLALTRRFRLRSLARLEADYHLVPEGTGWQATGTIRADAVQMCAATGQDVPERINSPFVIRFVAEGTAAAEEEVELSEQDCDVIEIEGERIDMGEAVAQTLALNLDPYPRVADADVVLRQMGVKTEGDEGGALAGLKDLLAKGKGG